MLASLAPTLSVCPCTSSVSAGPPLSSAATILSVAPDSFLILLGKRGRTHNQQKPNGRCGLCPETLRNLKSRWRRSPQPFRRLQPAANDLRQLGKLSGCYERPLVTRRIPSAR
jgi:hypothetical protein